MPGRSGLVLGRGGLTRLLRRHAGAELAPHLLELLAGRHLLREQRGLDAVEQALEPPDQLRLGDPQLGTRGGDVGFERERQAGELLLQVG